MPEETRGIHMAHGQRAALQSVGCYLGMALLGTALAAVVSLDYSLSTFLHWDDGLWVGKALLGEPRPYTHPILHALIAVFTGSLYLVKTLPLIGCGLLAGAVFLVLREHGSAPLLAAGASLAVVFYPISVDQTFYVIGSHPTWGLAFAVSALYCSVRAWRDVSGTGYLFVALSGIFGLMAAMTSPMMPLVVFAPLLWLGFLVASDHRGRGDQGARRLLVYAAVLVPPLLWKLRDGLLRNNYAEIGDGRVEPSLANVTPALLNALDLVTTPLKSWYFLGAVVLMLALVAWSSRAAFAAAVRSIDLKVPIMALMLSALVFAPNVAVSEEFLRDRYVAAPFVSAMIGVAALLLHVVKPHRAGTVGAFVVALTLLVVAEARWTADRIDALWGVQLANHEAAMAVVGQDAGSWPDNATVVFALEPRAKAPDPWWTTPLLQYLTDRRDLFALITASDEFSDALATQPPKRQARRELEGADLLNYRDDVYLRSVQRRVRIRGGALEGEEPLFVYTRSGATEPFEPAPLIVQRNVHQAQVVGVGQAPETAELSAIDLFPADCERPRGLVVLAGDAPGVREASGLPLVQGPLSWSFDGTGSIDRRVAAESGELVLLSFRLRPAEEPARSALPVVARAGKDKLLIRQQEEGFDLSYYGRVRGRWKAEAGAAQATELSFFGRQDCGMMLSVNGVMRVMLPTSRVFDRWTFGGSEKRYWSGSIEDWTLYGQNDPARVGGSASPSAAGG